MMFSDLIIRKWFLFSFFVFFTFLDVTVPKNTLKHNHAPVLRSCCHSMEIIKKKLISLEKIN